MNEICLYIMCGYSFAGKTTLAKALERCLGIARVDFDAINGARGVGLDGGPIAAEEWDITYAESYRQIREWLRSGRSVIFDAVNFTKAQRDELRIIAAQEGVDARVIYVALSGAEARARWQRNRITRERYDVRDEDFEHVVAQFEPPTEDERVFLYHPSQPLEEWIQQIF